MKSISNDVKRIADSINKTTLDQLRQYVVDYWDAMEDMNVLLGRHKKHKQKVLDKVNELR